MEQPPKTPPPGPRAPPPSRGAPPAHGATPPARGAAPHSGSTPPHRGAAASSFPDRVREMARSLAESFRRSDKFFRMRAGIVGAWVLISAVTFWAACPASGPENSLGADVRVLRDSLVGGQQLLVRNESTDNWTEVVFTLDDGWRRDQKTVRPHDQLVLSMSDFRREGQSAPRDFKPRRLVVECEQGRAAFDLR